MREQRRGESSPSWHLVWREAKPVPALQPHKFTEDENSHQHHQLFLTGTTEGQSREGLSPSPLFFGEFIKCLGLIVGAIFCCLNSPCHSFSPCALVCEASLGDNYAPSGNLWGRCEPARQKYDIFNQLFHSLAPASAPCPANLTRAPVKEAF